MLTVTGVHKSYGDTVALDGVDLDVPAGGLTAVLGPSGCGKTTLLRCVAGFERIDAGSIAVHGERIAGAGAHVPPHRRRIAVVPQDGALFPHLSVAANVGYGLDRAARRAGRVDEVLALVGLPEYGHRMPHQLSGGQQQRVAVARALAPRPPLVLLDEPFSALDAGLRAALRSDVRQALRADGATAVLVTHDQGEALSMADHVAVMHAGRIVQSGSPTAVYREPVNPWVAAFVGEAVLLPAAIDGPVAVTPLGRLALPSTLPAGSVPAGSVPVAGSVAVGLRGGRLRGGGQRHRAAAPRAGAGDPRRDSNGGDSNGGDSNGGTTATVVRHDFHGHDALVLLRLADGTQVTARVLDSAAALAVGDRVTLSVRGHARAFPAS